MASRRELSDGHAMFERGRLAHPKLSPDLDACRKLWDELLESGAVAEARAADAFLACAALAQDERAAKAIRARIESAAQRLRGVDVDDIAQRCWLRLFAAEPRVLRYLGHGDLDGLLRVTTRRLALNADRDAPKNESLEQVIHAQDSAAVAESTLATAQYAAAFKAGVEQAISHLSDEDRLLLKLHLVDTLGIDKLAGLLGVHRATVARRIERARERVAQDVRTSLRESLGEAGVEDSHLRRVRSQIDLSLSRILTE